MTTFLTVVSGCVIFVMGQFILKFVIDPIVIFKEVLGQLSDYFLNNLPEIYGNKRDQELQNRIRKFSASLMAKSNCIVWYSASAFLKLVPPKEDILKACCNLNTIACLASTIPEFKEPDTDREKLSKTIKDSATLLNIPLEYKYIPG